MPDAAWWMRSATVAFEAGRISRSCSRTRRGSVIQVTCTSGSASSGARSSVLDTAWAQEGANAQQVGRRPGVHRDGQGLGLPRRGRDPDGARPRAPGVLSSVSRMATPSSNSATSPRNRFTTRPSTRPRSAAGSRSSVPLTWANTPPSIDVGHQDDAGVDEASRPEVHEVPGPQVDLDGRSGALQDNDVVMIRETLERCLRNRGECARIVEVLPAPRRVPVTLPSTITCAPVCVTGLSRMGPMST